MRASLSYLIAVSSTAVYGATLPRGDDCQVCCSVLKAAGLDVLLPNTEAYKARDDSYFSVSAQLAPFCIVQPKDSSQVVKALNTIKKETDCNFAVRGGGHMTWPGGSDIHYGVTIDTSLMKTINYTPGSGYVSISAGALWSEVYAALQPYGVMAPGGRTSTVGVVGFLLGGGNNFYSAAVGFGCDNVVNFEVVLANGDIVNANKTDNPDLFKALKGGSSNFGIVTRVDVETIPVPKDGKFWGGRITYSLNTTDAQVDAYVRWVENNANYPLGMVGSFFAYSPATGIVVNAALHDTTGAEWAPAFNDFHKIEPKLESTVRFDTPLNFTIELDEPVGYRQIWSTLTAANDPRFIRAGVQKQAEFVEKWNLDHATADGGKPDMLNYITFQAMSTAVFEHSAQKGDNVLGMTEATRTKGNAIQFLMQTMVKTQEEENDARAQMIEMRRAWQEENVKDGIDFAWEYLGYADGTENVLASYGEANVKFLKEVAQKFDPEEFFQKWMPGGFKISKVSA
ncbi:hypothetical protein JX266_012614 [Neoarthrinium moseri]|nr:hypothetical protein JX266_012614 [Neoarthrinium moseri]